MFQFTPPSGASAAASGGAQRRRDTPKRQRAAEASNTKDEDALLDMDDKATRKLLQMVAKLALSSALQVRVLKSIALDVFLVKEDGWLVKGLKEATTAYAEQADKIGKEQRVQAIGMPHLHAWNKLLSMCKDVGAKNEQAQKIIDQYKELVGGLVSQGQGIWDILHTHCRYCRVQPCWAKNMKRLEVNIVCNSPAAPVWEIMKVVLKENGASERRGMAPPGNLEEKIQKAIDELA
eukprot:TRINITY_DN10501_c0_g2_i2.p2 TRINITY_DN10501_c0_g2~~TRINITY_DN10501_c0_g2_i2.p2  ORF type:complete len:235 (-),score=76.16 TRINITY_DN10501_c0_g2_i2:852-1556(-)